MSRKWIAGLVALVGVAGMGFAAGAALSGTESKPHYTPLTIDLSKGERTTARAKAGPGGAAKPKLVYLASSTPTTINTAEPAEGGFGAYIDLRLRGCSKVIDGGVLPHSSDVYVQGSYVQSPGKYHVLIGLDDAAAAASPRPTFQVDTNLTCLENVK
jgi:hypothetical protein